MRWPGERREADAVGVIDETVATEDIGEAEAFVRRVYPRAWFRETRSPFSFRQQVHADDRIAFARFAISSWAEIHVGFDGVLGVGQVRGGSYRAVSNDQEVDPRGPFLLRPGHGSSQSEGLDLLMVNVREEALQRFAGAWIGAPVARLRFPGVAPLDARRSALWARTVQFVESVFSEPALLANDLLRDAAADTLLAAALTAFPIEIVEGPRSPRSDEALPSAVRRALAHIEDNAHRSVSIDEIAGAARMSVRGLQTAFRRHLDTTPTAALKAARLSAAHAELVAADPGVASVAAIARRWGYQHLGRFAAEYRAQYGELPRDTLRR
jgi:AraC-like DNA-binding protein